MFTVAVTVNLSHPVHVHVHEESSAALIARVAALEQLLSALVGGNMVQIQETIDRLAKDVQDADTVSSSTDVFIRKIAQNIRDRVKSEESLLQFADSLEASTARMQKAMADSSDVLVLPATEQPPATT